MAGCVAGAMAHLQSVCPQRDGIAIGQPARGFEHPCWRKTISRSSLWQAVNPELVSGVRADDGQAAQLFGQIGRARGVVQVAVGDPDLFELEAVLGDGAQNQIEIATGIDHSRLATLIVPNQGTVLLKRCDRNGLVLQHVISPHQGPGECPCALRA